ncbi:uncharacterized protein LOC124709085 [Schistocerca piceifrons]|uniref:uncharacterized protein LOC124709085 n=1 Tax=Schistocerca piceifrons TaxID=274613 RepID=UPI001F5EE4F7|nr:uncharacterized protein LOC124709085 [Schistocerca piceifrons]
MEDIPWTEAVTAAKFDHLLGLPQGTVRTLSVKRLTKVGQNYGSTLLSIQVHLRDGETLDLVGKFMPPTEMQKKVFGSATTFLKEINAYRSVNVELIKLQRERGVPAEEVCDPLPRYYGSQVNSAGDDSMAADDNAVLLLENLASSGYRMADQMTGLDLPHARMLVRKIAQFQASAVALRLLKPQVFKDVIEGKCKFDSIPPDEGKRIIDAIVEHISRFPEVAPYCDKVKIACEQMSDFEKLWAEVVEPFVSLSHNDLWVNNMVFRYEDSEEPTDVKFFDFQTLTYSSPVRDLVFFLYTSLRHDLVGNSVDQLTGAYYESFVTWLKKLGCNTKDFTEAEFRKEIDRVAPTEIIHILMILNVICAEDHEKFSAHDMQNSGPTFSSSEMYRKKLLITLRDYDARGWLQDNYTS